MIADMLKSTLAFFADPATEVWMKTRAALLPRLLSGFGWMMLRRFVPVLGRPMRRCRERQSWQAVAARAAQFCRLGFAMTRNIAG